MKPIIKAIPHPAIIKAHDKNWVGNKNHEIGRNIVPIKIGYTTFWYFMYVIRTNNETITIEKFPPVIHCQPNNAKLR